MKLKLEVEEGVAILRVSEELSAQHAAILKAGVGKLFTAGRKELVLDLGSAGPVAPEAREAILSLRDLAQQQQAQLVIASPLEGLGQALDAKQATQMIRSPLFILDSQEAHLKTKQRLLEHHREDLQKKLSSSDAALVQETKKEHSELLHRVRELEAHITALIQGENLALKPLEPDSKFREAHRVAEVVLGAVP